MKNFYRLSQGANVVPLMAAIARKPELWKEDTYLRDYPKGPFGEIESIMLRFPARSVLETQEALKAREAHFDQHESCDQPAYKVLPEARQLVMGLMSFVGGERLGRVMVNKIAPGGRIYPHEDTPIHAEYWSRHHIVLQAGPGLLFRCGDEAPEMRTGDVWWFNNSIEHEVINNGADDRVSMVVDIRTPR
jgi:quercetin dioxygenase-like cupin family protein